MPAHQPQSTESMTQSVAPAGSANLAPEQASLTMEKSSSTAEAGNSHAGQADPLTAQIQAAWIAHKRAADKLYNLRRAKNVNNYPESLARAKKEEAELKAIYLALKRESKAGTPPYLWTVKAALKTAKDEWTRAQRLGNRTKESMDVLDEKIKFAQRAYDEALRDPANAEARVAWTRKEAERQKLLRTRKGPIVDLNSLSSSRSSPAPVGGASRRISAVGETEVANHAPLPSSITQHVSEPDITGLTPEIAALLDETLPPSLL